MRYKKNPWVLKRLNLLQTIHRRSGTTAHTELSYLQGTGTQYINTGIIGKSGLKIEIKVKFLSPLSTAFLIGSRTNSDINSFTLLTQNQRLRADYYTVGPLGATLTPTQPYVIIKDNNLTYVDGALQPVQAASSFNSLLPMYIFSVNSGGTVTTPINANIYYCKIWDTSGALVRDFAPAIKDGVYCLYDKVSCTYFYNQGIGSFTGA
jgi:hypothetical protein